MSQCPSREQLSLLLTERLSGPDADVVEGHVQVCEQCQKTLDEISRPESLDCGSRTDGTGSRDRFPPSAAFLQRLREIVPAACDTPVLGSGEGTDTLVCAAAESWPRVAGYELLTELGRGGMGVVYKARQTRLGRLVALKMLLAGVHAGREELSRFRTEAEAIARLQHPHIVQVFDVGDENGCPFLALEYVEGGNLADKLQGAPLPCREAAQMVALLAAAVHAAHQSGVVHRDLKPANVLLTADGTPKIADFGLAKRLDTTVAQTQSGTLLGTPNYMAPEQTEGRHVGKAADIYSLGGILYYLLTGRPPFLAESPLATLLLARTEDPVPPSVLQAKVPRNLETICLKCLEKAPGRRYASAAAVADDLRRFLQGEPIHARPASPSERLWRWFRRKPALAAALALGVATLVGAILVPILFALQQQATVVALLDERKKTEDALDSSRRQTAEARRQTAIQLLERGLALCEQHQEAVGLLWLARSLDEAPPEDAALQHTIRSNFAHTIPRLHPLLGIFPCPGQPLAVAFSPAGQMVAITSQDRTARIWSVPTGKPVGAPLQHQGAVRAVAISPDGQTVLTGSADHTARLWSLETGRSVGPPLRHQGEVLAVAFSPDGQFAVTASADKTARLWSIPTGQLLGPPLPHGEAVNAVAVSPDSNIVLTGSSDKTARLWSANTFQPLHSPLQHEGRVSTVAFSPDGGAILTGSYDNTARLWSVKTGKPLGRPLAHKHFVMAVAFSPDGQLALTGSWDKTARLWSVARGEPVGPPLYHPQGVTAVAFNPDGETVLTGGLDATARLWSAKTTPLLASSLQHPGSVLAVALSADGRMALTGGDDKAARLWAVPSGLPLGAPMQHPQRITAVAFSRDGQRVLTGGSDNLARVWSVQTRQVLGVPMRHPDRVDAVAFGPDGRTALTGCADGKARLWSIETGQPLGPPLPHGDGVDAVAFSPDGNSVLTGSMDRTARLWSVRTGQPLGPPLQHGDWVTSVAYSPDGKTVLTGSFDNTARLWSIETGQPLGPPLQHQHWISAVAFSPDGQTVLTGSYDKTARVWSVQTSQPLGPPLEHPRPIRAVAFGPEGLILTGCVDGAARFGFQRRLPPLDKDQLTLWLKTFTGIELDTFRALRVIDEKAFRERRQALGSERWLSDLIPDDDSGWHDACGGEAECSGNTFAALWHLDRLVAAHPDQWWYHARRARIYALDHQQKKADEDDARVLALGPWDQVRDWYEHRIVDCIARENWPLALGYANRLTRARPLDRTVKQLYAEICQKMDHKKLK